MEKGWRVRRCGVMSAQELLLLVDPGQSKFHYPNREFFAARRQAGTDAGIGRQPQCFAWATCQRARSFSVARCGMRCFKCQAALIFMPGSDATSPTVISRYP